MEKNIFKTFNNDLGWSTRIYFLLTTLTLALSIVFDAWTGNWVMTIIAAIAIVLFVELLAINYKQHPKTWNAIRLLILLILMAMLFIGAQ